MKVTKVSEHIWSIKAWMVIPVHVWLVKDEEGITLVDAGMNRMAGKISKVIKDLNAGPLKRVLLTHGHSDHTGAIKALAEEDEVPVYAHLEEIPYMVGERIYPRRKKLEFNVDKNIVKPLKTNDQGELSTIGGLTPYFTPGHSPGHVIYYHEMDQVVLAGDLFTSKKGKLKPPMPMFTADMAQAVRSSEIVSELNPIRLEVCHGGSVMNPAEQIPAYQSKNAE
ncbi:MBL fold metallo-hydrolase [Bacillus sp. CRN 9]|uniref:MBL fold metallo-hydrolase n=1 Tax=Cytobacillus horneckiae TaxID=549687 RepID=UPI001562E136|nr:MBL fold metallo-hydrolase [Bacillus sp. CRN 9]